MPAPPSQMVRVLACWPAPTAALILIPTAMESPSGTMNVSAAQEIAIWWAASGAAPSQPIITVAAANAPPSKRRLPEAGSPTPSIWRVRASEKGASQRRGHAALILGSFRSQRKMSADPSVRESSVEIPAPVRPRLGTPRCP